VDAVEAQRIMRLHQRAARAYKDGDYATSVRLYEELKAFTVRLGNEELIAKINRDMGCSYFRLGTPEALQKAVELGLAAREAFKRLGLTKLLPNVDMNIGNAYERQKKYEEARVRYQQARKLFEQIRRPDGITLADYNIGRTHFEQENFQAAITHLEGHDQGSRGWAGPKRMTPLNGWRKPIEDCEMRPMKREMTRKPKPMHKRPGSCKESRYGCPKHSPGATVRVRWRTCNVPGQIQLCL